MAEDNENKTSQDDKPKKKPLREGWQPNDDKDSENLEPPKDGSGVQDPSKEED